MNPIELKPTFVLTCTGAYAKGDSNIPLGVEIGVGEIYCTGGLTHTNAPSGFDIAEAGFCIVEKTEGQDPVFPEWVENGENPAYHACEAHDGNLSLLAKNFEVSKQYSVVAYFRYRYAGSTGDYTVIRTQTYQTVTVRPSSPSYNIGGTVPDFVLNQVLEKLYVLFK